MNLLHIARQEIRLNLRDKRTFSFMIAFPIILMLILGTALTNAFTNGIQIGDMKLLYTNTATNPQLTQYWSSFSTSIVKEGVTITSVTATDAADAKHKVELGDATAYAAIDDTGVHFYGSSSHTIESNIIQGMLTTFADKYNLAAAAVKENPSGAEAIIAEAMQANGDFIQEASLQADRQPGSIDYYAIAMSTMIALYASMSGAALISSEQKRNTMLRLAAAPVSKGVIFAGKIIGATIINFLCVVVVVLFSKFAFKADWGSHLWIVLLVLFSEVLLAISLGLGISYLRGDQSRAILLLFVQIASIVSGAYFPLGDVSGFMKIVTNLSPLRWANEALTKIIYTHDVMAALPVIGLNIACAVVFLAMAGLMMRKSEVL